MGIGARQGAERMTVVDAVTVRRGQVSDLVGIHRLEQACFSDPWEEESVAAALTLPHMQTWVAERDDGGERRLVGYVIGLMLGAEAEVADLAVDPAVQGQGVGGLLLDRLLGEARGQGVRAMFLEVRESNAAARGLYASRSFEVVGRRSGYYRHPAEDALLLRRDLVPA